MGGLGPSENEAALPLRQDVRTPETERGTRAISSIGHIVAERRPGHRDQEGPTTSKRLLQARIGGRQAPVVRTMAEMNIRKRSGAHEALLVGRTPASQGSKVAASVEQLNLEMGEENIISTPPSYLRTGGVGGLVQSAVQTSKAVVPGRGPALTCSPEDLFRPRDRPTPIISSLSRVEPLLTKQGC